MKKWINFIVILLSLWASLFYARNYFVPLLENGFEKYFLQPEFGQYLVEARRYFIENIYISDILTSFWEPWIFLIASSLGRIINIWSDASLIIVWMLMNFLTPLTVYILAVKTSWSKTSWLISILIFSTIYIHSFLAIKFWSPRQQLADLFLLTSCVAWRQKYINIKNIIPFGVIASMSIMSHRVGFVVYGLSYILGLIFLIISGDKKNYKNFISTGLITFILSCIFLYIYHLWYITEMIYKKIYMPDSVFFHQEDNFSITVSGFVRWWWDILTQSDSINHRPLVHYFLQEPYIIIFFIFSVKTKFYRVLKNNSLLTLSFIAVCSYTLFYLEFSTRLLWTFEILLIPIVAVGATKKINKLANIVIVSSIFILWFLWLKNYIIRSLIIEIDGDRSIEFIKSNIDKDSILLGGLPIINSGNQLWYLTADTIRQDYIRPTSMTDILSWKYNFSEKKLSSDSIRLVSQATSRSLTSKPEVFLAFKGKKLYVVLARWQDSQNAIAKYKDLYFSSPYLKLIYQDKGKGYFQYIFEVNMEKIIYFEDYGYYYYLFWERKW